MPTISVARVEYGIPNLPSEQFSSMPAPAKGNIEQWHHLLYQFMGLSEQQDVAVIIPVVKDKLKTFDNWDQGDKELWRLQIERIVERHHEALVQRAIDHLGKTQAVKEARAKEARLFELNRLKERVNQLGKLKGLTPQQRGKKFEPLLGDLFRSYNLDPTIDIRNEGEQIDFTFWFGSTFVVGEARWLSKNVDAPQVRDFFCKLLDRAPATIGLVISMSGFTEPALKYLRKYSGNRTVLTLRRAQFDKIMAGDPEFPHWFSTDLRYRLEHPDS